MKLKISNKVLKLKVLNLKTPRYFINLATVFLTFYFFTLQTLNCFSQTPQAFKYQVIVRTNTGIVIPNQNVNLRISLLQNSATGTQVYSEEHAVTTNIFGLINLEIGNGTNQTGTFATIDWSTGIYFIKIELDINGGSTFSEMGTTQLLSVPYAIYAGNGDKPVSITGSGATSVTGTYPDFTISSTDSNNTYFPGTGLSLTGTTFNSVWTASGNNIYNNNSGFTGIGTTNPTTALHINGTLRITDDTEGSGKIFTSDANGVGSWQTPLPPAIGTSTGTANYIPKFINTNALDNSLIYQNGNRLGVGTINPSGTLQLQQDTSALDTDPIFEIKDKTGQTVMVVYKDSVHFFVKDDTSGAKAYNRGSFAVSGKSQTKSLTNDFLRINADSTRIYTTDTTKGFGVQNIYGNNKTSYMQLTPKNYFIGHESGSSITTGEYNSFIGYLSGKKNDIGIKNTFMGYKSGMNNEAGNYNVFIGVNAGLNNDYGDYNCFLGIESGLNNTSGNGNTFIGGYSGLTNVTGNYNTFIGYESGKMNSDGNQNTFLGSFTGKNNTSGYINTFIGDNAGYNNTTGYDNIFIGSDAGVTNIDGYHNLFIGHRAGFNNTSGIANIFIGSGSGENNTIGSYNMAIGPYSGKNITTGNDNSFFGATAGYSTTTGDYNCFFGEVAGAENTTGSNNCYFGREAGYLCETGNFNSFFGGKAGYGCLSGQGNCFFGYAAGNNDTIGNYNVYIGNYAGLYCNANSNVLIGNSSGDHCIGDGNVLIGRLAGRYANSNNVMIGYFAGINETGSDKLYIENSFSSTPLIGGDFSTNRVGINRMPTTYTLEVGGTIWANGSTITAGVTTWSDIRYKTNINTIDNSLSQILKIRGVTYDWKYSQFPDKNFPTGNQIGVIAQEIEKIFPQLVLTDNEGYKSVAYEKITPILIEAVKELNNKNITQENTILELKTMIDFYNEKQLSLSKEIDKLRAEIESIKPILVSIKK